MLKLNEVDAAAKVVDREVDVAAKAVDREVDAAAKAVNVVDLVVSGAAEEPCSC
ncbi:MAG: hypothetical protein Aurels2KO_05600 [Aureliella sp.]